MSDSDNSYRSADSNNELTEQQVASNLNISQIITIALVFGLIGFTAFAVYSMYAQKVQVNWKFDTIVIVGLALLVPAVLLSILIPKLVSASSASSQAEAPSEELLGLKLGQFQQHLIIGLAILEGCGFLNIVTFMRHHHPLSLFAAILCIGLMIVRLPTRSKVDAWLNEHLNGQRQ